MSEANQERSWRYLHLLPSSHKCDHIYATACYEECMSAQISMCVCVCVRVYAIFEVCRFQSWQIAHEILNLP